MTLPLSSHSAKVPALLPALIVTLLLLLPFLHPLRVRAQEPAAPAPSPAEQATQPAVQPVNLSDEVVQDVLSPFQRAIETRDYSLLLGTFDAAATSDFAQIREQFDAFFRLHDNIKFRYQLLQVSADKDLGFAMADVDMDAQPRDDLPTEQRRTAQMRFQMKRTAKGWRLTGLKPMDFFTQ